MEQRRSPGEERDRDGGQGSDEPSAGQPTVQPDAQEWAAGSRKVSELMSTELYAVSEDETVLMAWELLERTGVHHLPVLHPDGRCAGLLDRSDLAIACGAPAVALSGRRVGSLVRGRRAAVVHGDDTLRRAAIVMTDTGVDALPVLAEHGFVVGLLTARDIVAAFAGHPVHRAAADQRPGIPFPLIPGLPPRREGRGSAMP